MPVSIRKEDHRIIVKVPVGEVLVMQVHRPLQVPFNIGAAIKEAAWGMIQIHAKKKLDGMKIQAVSMVLEEGNAVVTFDEKFPEGFDG